MEARAVKIVNDKTSIIVKHEALRGFIEAELLEFKLIMHVNSFANIPFISCGEQSSWLRMAMHSDSNIIMLSFSLWNFLKHTPEYITLRSIRFRRRWIYNHRCRRFTNGYCQKNSD